MVAPEGPSSGSQRGPKWDKLLKMTKIMIFLLLSLLHCHWRSKFAVKTLIWYGGTVTKIKGPWEPHLGALWAQESPRGPHAEGL